MHILFKCAVECLHDYRLTLITLNDNTIISYKQLTREKFNLSHLPYIFTEYFCIEEKCSAFKAYAKLQALSTLHCSAFPLEISKIKQETMKNNNNNNINKSAMKMFWLL